MEHLCETYPNESILFLKRAICTTIVTGFVLTTPIIICVWNSPKNESDESLRVWSLIRILLFFIQIPLRYDVWNKLNKCAINESLKRNMLVNILRSDSWKCTQIGSFIVSLWVCITIISTYILKDIYGHGIDGNYYNIYICFEGYLSPCLLRWCYVSIFIFVSHITFIIYSLRHVTLIMQLQSNSNSNHNEIYHDIDEYSNCSICIDNKHNEKNNLFSSMNAG
eukprot:UN09545